jgi:hypothetical protein
MHESSEFCLEQATKCMDLAHRVKGRRAQQTLLNQAADWLRLAEGALNVGSDTARDAPRYLH